MILKLVGTRRKRNDLSSLRNALHTTKKEEKMDDLYTKPTYIVIDAFGGEQDGMRITEEEQLLFNKQMDELFGINVTSSPTEKTNGST